MQRLPVIKGKISKYGMNFNMKRCNPSERDAERPCLITNGYMKYLIQTCLKAPRLLGFHVSESAFGNLISEGGVLYTINNGFNIIMIGNYFAIVSQFETLFSKLIDMYFC